MIRSNLPLPFLYRLRLNAGAAARRGAEPGNGLRASRQSPTRRPAAASELWEDFVNRYETFTGVLCAAAKSGCTAQCESEYAQLRRWFVGNYYRMSGRLKPALEAEFADDAFAMPRVADYAGQVRTLDPLEALFVPATLEDVLLEDSGDLIPRIMRISEVVYRSYEEWSAAQAA